MAQKILEQVHTLGRGSKETAASLETARRPDDRLLEGLPGILSWVVALAPIWLTAIKVEAGLAFVMAATFYFAVRVSYFGLRSLANRARVLGGMKKDWLADLERLERQDWREYRLTLLIRAFREGNRGMLRETLLSIYNSNWPRDGELLHNVEVVFATEEIDPVTPPLVDELAREFAGKLIVRQVRHPKTPGHLPGPSSAMHYVGKVLYQEAAQSGVSPHYWLVADFDCDSLFHPQYLPSLVCHYATDEYRHRHAYQPLVLFTTDFWHAPLHSRLSAIGTSVLTLGWNRRPEIAFTGAAASLALLKSVDFWPTNSHSQDSGVELRLRLRYGPDFSVVGIPVPVSVYPVMMMGKASGVSQWLRAYARSFRALFRQSARWREGPLDEFVESAANRHPGMTLRKLWNGLERDTLTLLPSAGPIATQIVIYLRGDTDYGTSLLPLAAILAFVLTVVSTLGITAFGQMLVTGAFVPSQVPFWRKAVELFIYWLIFSIYVPVLTACAGLKTSSAYLLGRRPRGHYVPTPK